MISQEFIASYAYADFLWARHAISPPQERLRDEPKESLRRRLRNLKLLNEIRASLVLYLSC